MNEVSTKKIIIGAGRQAAETFYLIKDIDPNDDITAFAVDQPEIGQRLLGKEVIEINEVIKMYNLAEGKPSVLLAIGDISSIKRLSQLFKNYEFRFFSAINKSVATDRQRVIGEGVTIADGTILTCNISIGNHVLINIGCTISHDCIIGDYVNISPGCHLAGRVEIGDDVFVGTGATFIPKIKVGKGSIIAAGSCITKDVPPYTMVAGVPGVVKRQLNYS